MLTCSMETMSRLERSTAISSFITTKGKFPGTEKRRNALDRFIAVVAVNARRIYVAGKGGAITGQFGHDRNVSSEHKSFSLRFYPEFDISAIGLCYSIETMYATRGLCQRRSPAVSMGRAWLRVITVVMNRTGRSGPSYGSTAS